MLCKLKFFGEQRRGIHMSEVVPNEQVYKGNFPSMDENRTQCDCIRVKHDFRGEKGRIANTHQKRIFSLHSGQ